MSAVPFDPTAYVADMCAIGAVLTPYTVTTSPSAGRRAFSISAGGEGGIPGDVLTVAAKWEDAALAHEDWIGAVHDALVAEIKS